MAKATRASASKKPSKKAPSVLKKPSTKKAPSVLKKPSTKKAPSVLKKPSVKMWPAWNWFLRQGYQELCKAPQSLPNSSKAKAPQSRKHSLKLVHVTWSGEIYHSAIDEVVIEAYVNWFQGGTSCVSLPAAVAEVDPGVYLAEVQYAPNLKDVAEEDQGPKQIAASLTDLWWVGTRSEFMQEAARAGKELGKKKRDKLMTMLTSKCNNASSDLEAE
jgi:hypothetical protein